LVRKFEGKKQYRRPGHRWEDNIKMGPQELGWKGVHGLILPKIDINGMLMEHGNESMGSVKSKIYFD
jgi:hypothetical protein